MNLRLLRFLIKTGVLHQPIHALPIQAPSDDNDDDAKMAINSKILS